MCGRLLGQGMVTSDGKLWLRERKLAQPAFRHAALETYYPVMVETAAAFLREFKSRFRPGRPVEISREMSRLTLRIIAKTIFKVDFTGNEDRFLQATTDLLVLLPDPLSQGWLRGRVYKYFRVLAYLRADKARRTFEQGVSWIIENRRDPGDLIALFEAGSADATSAEDKRRIHDEVATFLLAGHETTAAGLTWTLYLLSQNPGRGAEDSRGDRRRPRRAAAFPGGPAPAHVYRHGRSRRACGCIRRSPRSADRPSGTTR